jgi:hypothetical protein
MLLFCGDENLYKYLFLCDLCLLSVCSRGHFVWQVKPIPSFITENKNFAKRNVFV